VIGVPGPLNPVVRPAGASLLTTAIERLLYGDLGVQGITQFAISQNLVRIVLSPFEGPRRFTIATFHEARLNYVEASADSDDDFELPWQVIGFDCYELSGHRWRFILNCAILEWCFESAWPVVERTDA
jgi:hypothetical protein